MRVALAIIFLALFWPSVATALAMQPIEPYLLPEFKNVPPGAVYVDLLTRISEEKYAESSPEALEAHDFSADAGIVSYDTDGYRSFTFHYKFPEGRAPRLISIGSGGSFDFLMYEGGMAGETLKFALVDEQGNVLAVSNAFTLEKNRFDTWKATYDAKTGSVKVQYLDPTIGCDRILTIVYGVAILLVFGIEVGAAAPFFKRQTGKSAGIKFLKFCALILLFWFALRSTNRPLMLPLAVFAAPPILFIFELITNFFLFRKKLKKSRILLGTLVSGVCGYAIIALGIYALNFI